MRPEDVPDELVEIAVNGLTWAAFTTLQNEDQDMQAALRASLAAVLTEVMGDQAERIEQIQAERGAMSEEERCRLDAADAPLLRIQLAGYVRRAAEAEADRDRHRALAEGLQIELRGAIKAQGEAEATVARVRALAQAARDAEAQSLSRQFGGAPCPASVPADDVLAALDQPGDTGPFLPCPNNPPCPHPDLGHDDNPDDSGTVCCAKGCDCGQPKETP